MDPADGRSPTLVLYRNATAARVVGTLLLVASVFFGAVFVELTLRSESLRCEAPQNGAAACQHVRSWPLVSSRASALSPVVAARTRASARGGGTNVVLLLEHADRTVSEYPGVGALGDRAETVALQMNDHLAGGQQSATFALRQANEVFGVALLLLFCVLPFGLLPALYARVRVYGRPNPGVVVGRGLLPARHASFDRGTPPQLDVQTRVVGGNTVYVLRIVGAGAPLDLMSSSDLEACHTLEQRIQAALAG